MIWEPDGVIRTFYDQVLNWERQVSSPECVEARAGWVRSARKSSRDGGTHTVVGLGDVRGSSGKNSLCKGPGVG